MALRYYESMGNLWGLPMASSHLFSGDLAEAGRPLPRVMKATPKESNLPSSFHPQCTFISFASIK
jgi:hypothetical protein